MPAKKAATKKTAAKPALIQAKAEEPGILQFFPYQEESITAPWRFSADEWARQTGKTYKGSSKCLLTCVTIRRAMAVTMSASLRQGELVIRKDAEVWRDVVMKMRKLYGQDSARPDKDKLLFTSPVDDDKGQLIDLDAIADMLSTSRLSCKVQWGQAADDYALHQIFAANPDTARGATADDLFWDEALLTPDFRECLRALRSMANRRPRAQFKLASSPPISSSHESWEIFYNEDTFPVNPRGNWRTGKAGDGEQGMRIHRVDAYDAEAAGIKSYDEVGKIISVADMRAQSDDKEGFDREALLKYRSSGGVAIPYSCLVRAQTDGRQLSQPGLAVDLGSLSDLNELSDDGLRTELRKRIPFQWACSIAAEKGTAFGHDQSSSDKEGTSNPASLTCTQEAGIYRHQRLIVRWLTRFPRVTDMIHDIVITDAKAAGARLDGLGIDGSNDYLNAERMRDRFSRLLPVVIYKAGEKHPTKPTNMKEHLGSQYAQLFLDGLMTLPPGPEGRSNDWVLQDHSLAVRGPSGITNLTSRGYHGDTFDSGKYAEGILSAGGGRIEVFGADGGTVTTRSPGADDPDGFLIGHGADDEPGAFES